ncbi:hypothetical protein [Actinoallomurus sp. NPDC050550]|uniref:hypothetical protein n=1 Tax=Actinoallomurus sp. NPDC050550 TaxID=3154937 RepID=UPI0033E6391D
MRSIKFAAVTAAAGFALSMLAAPSAQAATDGRGSVKCGKGFGGNARVNFSWMYHGDNTVVYFNNHCAKGKKITAQTVWYKQSCSRGICEDDYRRVNMDTHGKTHGKKKFSDKGYTLVCVDRGHPADHC